MSAKRKTLSLLLGLMACVAALVMTNLQSEKESVLDAASHINTLQVKGIVKNLILEEGPPLSLQSDL
jgi:hypothetical protein